MTRSVHQRGAGAADANAQASQLDRPPLDVSRQTYLSVGEARDYLHLRSTWALYRFLRVNAIPKCRLNPNNPRSPFVLLRRDLDRAAQQSRQIDDAR